MLEGHVSGEISQYKSSPGQMQLVEMVRERAAACRQQALADSQSAPEWARQAHEWEELARQLDMNDPGIAPIDRRTLGKFWTGR